MAYNTKKRKNSIKTQMILIVSMVFLVLVSAFGNRKNDKAGSEHDDAVRGSYV